MLVLETPRLTVRPFMGSDVAAAHVWFSDPEVFRFYKYGPYTLLEQTAERVRQYCAHFEKHGFGKCVVVEKSTGIPIGDAGFSFADDIGEVHVGYKLARSHWGKGYATEAAQAWVQHGFDRLGLKRILAFVHPQNAGSIRVIEKLQFSPCSYNRFVGTHIELIYELRQADYANHSLIENRLRNATIGEPNAIHASIPIADYDPLWPALFDREGDRIRKALGTRVLLLEHVGSTSIPGLAAKPIIDLVLAVTDAADEPAYVPALEGQGYVLRIREPQLYEHRMFKGPDIDINHGIFLLRPELNAGISQSWSKLVLMWALPAARNASSTTMIP